MINIVPALKMGTKMFSKQNNNFVPEQIVYCYM